MKLNSCFIHKIVYQTVDTCRRINFLYLNRKNFGGIKVWRNWCKTRVFAPKVTKEIRAKTIKRPEKLYHCANFYSLKSRLVNLTSR